MLGKDSAASKAFVRYYWDVVSYAQVSGDTGRLRELSFEQCEPCSAGVDTIDEVYDAGGSIKGGRFRVSELTSKQLQRGEVVTYSVEFTFKVAPEFIRYRKGEKPKKRAGGGGRLRLLVSSDAPGTWRISQWDIP